MTITLAANVSGTMDDDDKRAIITRIVQANVGRAVQLPWDTNQNIKNSYQTILSELVLSEHLKNIDQASTASGLDFAGFSDSDKKAIRKKAIDLVQGGQTVAQVVAKVSALT
jgi:hypothetical protein